MTAWFCQVQPRNLVAVLNKQSEFHNELYLKKNRGCAMYNFSVVHIKSETVYDGMGDGSYKTNNKTMRSLHLIIVCVSELQL